MKKISWILFVSFLSLQLSAQTIVRGFAVDSNTGMPLAGVRVTLANQNISTQTNAAGEFLFTHIEAGGEQIRLTHSDYFDLFRMIFINEDEENNLGVFPLRLDMLADAQEDILLQLSEAQLDDGENTQMLSGVFTSAADVFLSQTNFNFSPMRFRTRGYDSNYETTFVNGVRFTDPLRGGFNFGMLGSLNNAFRRRDVVYGLEANSFSFGNLGTNTNIDARASNIAIGHNVSGALSNRASMLRGQYTYGTGVLNNGWSFAVSAVIRYTDPQKSIFNQVQGTFMQSAGLFFSAEKFFNLEHSISFLVFGAPTQRAGRAPITQEARDLAGINYNPWWGYQMGHVRSARIVRTFTPTGIFSHEWRISDTQRLTTGIGIQHNWFSNNPQVQYANNPPHPAPDNWRYMPSAFAEGNERDYVTQLWRNNTDDIQQTRWHDFYAWNRQNNENNPEGQALYMLSRRHTNTMAGMLNSTYVNQLSEQLRLTAGVGASRSRVRQFHTVEDLLGANQWLDIDNFAQRNVNDPGSFLFGANYLVFRNDINSTDSIRKVGDIWDYKFDLHITNLNAFAQLEYNLGRINMHAALQGVYTSFYRYGHMENGRTWWMQQQGMDVNSLGKGNTWWFIDPSVKGGFSYNIDNRNFISANVLAETRAPLVNNSFVAERTRDDIAPHLTNERILSYDLNYHFNHPVIRGRISGFRTHIHDRVDRTIYYDDDFSSLVNHVMSSSNRLLQGVEVGVNIPLNRTFTLNAALSLTDQRYTNNGRAVISSESGDVLDVHDEVMTKGLRVSNGPQTAANVQLRFFRNMWFADISVNYFDRSFASFSPARFARSTFGNLPAEFYDERNMNALRREFMLDGNVDIARLEARMTEASFRNRWGLQADEAVNFGRLGGIIQNDPNGNTYLGSSAARQALGTQERLPSGFLVDVSLGRIIFLPNRRQVNINISVNNVLNNTNLISTSFQQGRMAMSGNQINEAALDRFPNRNFWVQGFNFSAHVGYRF